MNKQITIFTIIFLIAGFAWLKFTNNLDEQRHEAYENCEPMVDINGELQMVCK